MNEQDGFNKLLLLLDSDRDQAGVKYEDARRRLSCYFEKRAGPGADELVDETMSRVAGKLAAGEEVRDIGRYWFGVARFVLKEHWVALGREIPDLDELLESREPFFDPLAAERDREADRFAERKGDCMLKCLQSLPADDRRLVAEYSARGDGEQIAQRLGTTVTALRVKVHRIRAKLKKCLDACLHELSASEI